MNSSKSGSREKVRVVVRVRPFNNKELAIASSTTCVKLQEQSLEISVDEAVHNFQFDRVFGPESNQLEVFEYTATPLILDVLSGYNATIFAYGQTGYLKVTLFTVVHHDYNLRPYRVILLLIKCNIHKYSILQHRNHFYLHGFYSS